MIIDSLISDLLLLDFFTDFLSTGYFDQFFIIETYYWFSKCIFLEPEN
jgi:hypothetical protein